MGAALVIVAILELICAAACVLIFIMLIHLMEDIEENECDIHSISDDLSHIRFKLGMEEYWYTKWRKERKNFVGGDDKDGTKGQDL